MQKNNDTKLIEEIENKIKTVRTRSLDMSFNELLDMYKSGELIISPEYQRLFRWSEGSQSRFIESLLLEMPIPPIFVIEKDEGIYELIDGLQRISSYLHFRGALPKQILSEEDSEAIDEDTYSAKKSENFLVLSGCDICEGLNGLTYDTLPKTLEIRLKRNFVRVEILRKESDARLRYHMFKRLNTGGESLTAQEIRNCTIRLLSPKFNDFLIKCSNNKDYKKCISNISEKQNVSKYDQELVLRFFAFKNNRPEYKHDIDSYLSDYMEKVSAEALPFDYQSEEEIFNDTFSILEKTLGSKSFAPASIRSNSLANKFAIYHYEAICLSVAKYLSQLKIIEHDNILANNFKTCLTSLKTSSKFKELTTGGGKNYSKPLNDRIKYIETGVKKFVDELR